jgi:hypothetical protein
MLTVALFRPALLRTYLARQYLRLIRWSAVPGRHGLLLQGQPAHSTGPVGRRITAAPDTRVALAACVLPTPATSRLQVQVRTCTFSTSGRGRLGVWPAPGASLAATELPGRPGQPGLELHVPHSSVLDAGLVDAVELHAASLPRQSLERLGLFLLLREFGLTLWIVSRCYPAAGRARCAGRECETTTQYTVTS